MPLTQGCLRKKTFIPRIITRNIKTFHTQPRPQITLNNTSSVLWSYFKAPSNVLFVTTNIIGLGIITSYRALSTLAANSDNKAIEEQEIDHSKNSYRSLEWDFTSNGFLPSFLKRKKKSNSKILSNVDKEAFKNDQVAEYVSEGSFVDEAALPLTELDLNYLGTPVIRNSQKEKSKLIMINYLLMMQYFYGSLNHIFDNKLNLTVCELKCLPEQYKASILKILMKYVDSKDFVDFDSFLDAIPAAKFNETIMSYHASGIKHQLLKRCDELKLDAIDIIENNQIISSNLNFNKEFNNIYDKYKNIHKLDNSFFLDTAELLMKSTANSIDYNKIVSKLNENIDNQNFSTFLNVIGTFLLNNKNEYLKESSLKILIKNSYGTLDKSVFNRCMEFLNLEEHAVVGKRHRKIRATKRIKHMTEGNSVSSYSYSLRTYILALKGILKFNPENSEYILNSTKRILFEMKCDARNRIRVNFDNSIAKQANDIDSRVWTFLPEESIQLFINIGIDYKNESLLKSTIGMMEKSKYIRDDMYIMMLEKMAKSPLDESFLQMINELRYSKMTPDGN